MLPHWLVALLAVFATFRVTRLITRDEIPIIALPREAFVQRWATYIDAKTPEKRRVSLTHKKTNIVMSSLAYLWECDWCMSVWVAAGIGIGTFHWIDAWWWQIILLAASASAITGLIAQREPD